MTSGDICYHPSLEPVHATGEDKPVAWICTECLAHWRGTRKPTPPWPMTAEQQDAWDASPKKTALSRERDGEGRT